MPNGYPDDKMRIWRASRLWGTVWQVGDAAYYVGLLASLILPWLILGWTILSFRGWGSVPRMIAITFGLFVSCFFTGVLARGLLQGIAESCVGVNRLPDHSAHEDNPD